MFNSSEITLRYRIQKYINISTKQLKATEIQHYII